MNLPISVWKDKETGKFHPVRVMPRKEACFTGEDIETEKEFQELCDKTIAAYENAVELFKLLKQHKIDYVYYFDSPEKYLEDKKIDDKYKENKVSR